MLEYGTCCGCLSLRKECIVFGLVDFITQIPHVAVDVGTDGVIAFMDLIVVIIGTLLSGLLVYGAIMRNISCLWLWIFVTITRTLLFVVGLVFFVIAVLGDLESSRIAAAIQEEFGDVKLEVLIGLVSINIAIYVFLMGMVYRYICQILDEEAIECEEYGDESI